MSETKTTAKADTPDRRRNAWREDLASESLRGQVKAPRYVAGVPKQLLRPSVPMRREPDASAAFENEILFGEFATVLDEANGWAWVQLARDGYVGYVPADVWTDRLFTPTHRVQTLGTFVYPRADIKSAPLLALSINAAVAVTGSDDRFSEIATGGFIYTRHLAEIAKPARDYVEVAEQFIGIPYLWGGRTRTGLDCSGLVQIATEAAGIRAPRDSDMQQAELGAEVLIPADLEGLQRGDLVFWRGHVGVMIDGVMLVHANAHHMSVAVEPLVSANRRIARTGSVVTAVKRLPSLGGGDRHA
jgi:cell wall-associated NlpC family hydrolase